MQWRMHHTAAHASSVAATQGVGIGAPAVAPAGNPAAAAVALRAAGGESPEHARVRRRVDAELLPFTARGGDDGSDGSDDDAGDGSDDGSDDDDEERRQAREERSPQ